MRTENKLINKKWRFQYGGPKCDYILNLDESLLILILTVLDIFDDEFLNSILRNKKMTEPK